jgi:hypothetical protein
MLAAGTCTLVRNKLKMPCISSQLALDSIESWTRQDKTRSRPRTGMDPLYSARTNSRLTWTEMSSNTIPPWFSFQVVSRSPRPTGSPLLVHPPTGGHRFSAARPPCYFCSISTSSSLRSTWSGGWSRSSHSQHLVFIRQ